MNVETTVLLTVLVPILGSFATPLAGLAGRRVRSAWAVLVSGATAILPLTLLPFALKGAYPQAALAGPPAGVLRLPLVHQHEHLGELILAPRAGDEGFAPEDRRLL